MSATEQPHDDAVIRLEQVCKEFGSFVAVQSADLTIARGEFFAMLGLPDAGRRPRCG